MELAKCGGRSKDTGSSFDQSFDPPSFGGCGHCHQVREEAGVAFNLVPV